jgi:site-specific recombinase XerD
MSFESTFDIHEIAETFGISYEKLINFLKEQGNSDTGRLPTSELFVKDVIPQYLQNIENAARARGISIGTQKTYTSFINNFNNFILEKYSLLQVFDLNSKHLTEFLSTCKPRKGEEVSPYTFNTYTAILRNFTEYLFVQKLLSQDIRHRFDWKKRPLLPRYLPDEHLRSLLRAAIQSINGYRNHAIISVLVGSGLRVSELTKLKINDINLYEKTIRVIEGKGNKDRTVPLYKEVETIIKDYLNVTGFKEWVPNHNGYVFAKDYGTQRVKRLSVNGIETMMKRLCRKLEFTEQYTPHSLRHTFSVRSLQEGMQIEYLSQVLGHTNIMTTYIYLQLLPQDLGKVLTEKFPFPFQNLLNRVLRIDEHEIT